MERGHAEQVCSLQLHGLSDLSSILGLQGCGVSHGWDYYSAKGERGASWPRSVTWAPSSDCKFSTHVCVVGWYYPAVAIITRGVLVVQFNVILCDAVGTQWRNCGIWRGSVSLVY